MENQIVKNHPIIWGTIVLTSAGILSRFIGFFYRIFLSHTIGAEGMGIYQLIFPVYTLCFALTVFGIQTAISRYVAADLAMGNIQRARDTFLLGTVFSTVLSTLAAIFIHRNATYIGSVILMEERTVPLLRLLTYSIPFAAVHTCVNAYYYATKKTGIPAISQLLEQIVRVGASCLMCAILLEKGLPVNALVAVVGILAGELCAMLFSIIVISLWFHKEDYRLRKIQQPMETLEKLFTLSLPLTGNRLMITLLHSGENILIPSRLEQFGMSSGDALSVFGVLTGMSLPLLLFPSTLTNSVAVMLMPSVSELQALGKEDHIRQTVNLTVHACFLLGVVFMVFFFLLGPWLGNFIFQEDSSGRFLRVLAFICPFLYLNTTLMSILNGMGRTLNCFLHNSLALGIRICFVLFAIPVFGIKGYLWGILVGELLLAVLNFLAVYRILYRQKK